MVDAVARDASGLEVVRLDHLPLAEVQSALAALPRDSIVMYEGFARDADGATYFPADVAASCCAGVRTRRCTATSTACSGAASSAAR